MIRKRILFCNRAHGVHLALSGGSTSYERIQTALETDGHEVTLVPNLATALDNASLPENIDNYDFAVLHASREYSHAVSEAMRIPCDGAAALKQQEIIPYLLSLNVLERIRGVQQRMKIILYRSHNPGVVSTCIARRLIDFYTRAEENGVATLEDEVRYIQRCIAGQIQPLASLA